MKTCYQCFKKYEKEKNICPHCGYKENAVEDASYLIPDTILYQRYMIGKVLGAGGFGITYATWDTVLEQRVAIKEYLPGEFSTRSPGQTQITIYSGEKAEQFHTGKDKFLEESKRLAKFQDISGIVQIFDSFQENETVYIVMEYLDGETLESRLKRQNKMPEQEAIEIIVPVLQALESVHKEGILHRDIAPNNIFLCKTGEVKLLDFGAARSVTGSHSKSLTVLYKEGYTAEEQYRSRGGQGAWTDVYSCAATLYRMLTGVVPQSALERRVKDTLKPPAKYVHISGQTNMAILNALNVDLSYRTQSAGNFMEELTGKKKVKNHFVRTIERRIDTIPLGIRIALGLAISIASVLCILLFSGVIQFNVGSFDNLLVADGKVRVPNIVNLEVDEAQDKMKNRNLSIQIQDKQFSDSIPKDRILSQSIKAGKVMDQGSTIEVVVSGGEKTLENGYELKDNEVFVPDFQYQDILEIVQLYEDVELTSTIVFEDSDTVGEGKIITQNLESGKVVDKDSEVILTVSSPEFIRQAYEYMMNKDYNSLLSVQQEIEEFMQDGAMDSILYCPKSSEEMVNDGEGLILYNTDGNIQFYLGEYEERNLEGNGSWAMRCGCGSDEPYFIYEGQWSKGMAQGHGIVYAHWNTGEKYQVEGQFNESYADGTMQMQWEDGGTTYHGQFNCTNKVIQAAPYAWYSQYFQTGGANRYFYVYSQESDAMGIPWSALTVEDGYGISLVGLMEVN